jgi:hypothetical protein
VLRVFVVLPPLAAVLISCSTAPSTASNDYSDSGQLIGELEVFERFIIVGTPDAAPAESTLWPGRFAARLDRLQRDEIVIDVDAPGIGDLTVRLEEDAGEFAVGNGGFAFTASQHDLPYTIYGEHTITRTPESSTRFSEICYFDELRESCYTADDGETTCTLYSVRIPGTQIFEREVTRESEEFGMTFVDAQARAVVARYSAYVEPYLEERIRPEGGCRDYR